eukprot:maker-scaffold_25-snap-gene-5.54-mRNA-1 protein AED:0.00 eAED:0.00 QI:104/1/1/1/1/1/2/121/234
MNFLSLAHHGNKNFVLHLYDHCPFCIRVELLLNLRSIPYKRVVYGYGDVEGVKSKFEKKVLPVLEYEEKGEKQILRESLDILKFVDGLDGDQKCLLAPSTGRFSSWLKKYGEPRRILTRPRIIQMPLKDWEEERDITYMKSKYESQGFSFEDAEKNTESAIKSVEEMLKELDVMLFSEQSVNSWGISMDDILLFPDLRSLTCVKNISWPEKTLKWINNLSSKAKVALYFDDAVE